MPTYSYSAGSPFAPKKPAPLNPNGVSLLRPQASSSSLTKSPLSVSSSRAPTAVNVKAGAGDAFAKPPPISNPGNNLTNPGYDEQAFLYTQNQLLNDPSQGMLTNAYNQAQKTQPGQQYMNQNLGTLDGPGQGDQYWNQVSGQF